MRQAITISLPAALQKTVNRAVRAGNFATTSEFFRALVRRWEEENALVRAVKKSEQEFSAGKGKKLRSLKELR
ncbi:MAG: ribbon-helix-helix domain-containing protein [Patescibacteria group bacterium]